MKMASREQDPTRLIRDIREVNSHELLKQVEEHFDEMVNPFLLMPG